MVRHLKDCNRALPLLRILLSAWADRLSSRICRCSGSQTRSDRVSKLALCLLHHLRGARHRLLSCSRLDSPRLLLSDRRLAQHRLRCRETPSRCRRTCRHCDSSLSRASLAHPLLLRLSELWHRALSRKQDASHLRPLTGRRPAHLLPLPCKRHLSSLHCRFPSRASLASNK